MRKAVSVFMSLMLAFTIGACGTDTSEGTAAPEEPVAAESGSTETAAAPVSDAIDLTLEGGNLKYTGFEKANSGLTEYPNALVFYFDFTNLQDEVSEVQNVFRIQFFQNGVELSKSPSYSSKGGDQYDDVGAFFNDVMKNGTVHFARIVIPEDDSPITILASGNGGTDKTTQMYEVNIGGGSQSVKPADDPEPAASISAEDIDSILQGTWKLSDGSGNMSFENGKLVVSGNGQMLSGTYDVDTDEQAVIGHIDAGDSKLKITIPYTYEDGKLTIYNNRGVDLIKQ